MLRDAAGVVLRLARALSMHFRLREARHLVCRGLVPRARVSIAAITSHCVRERRHVRGRAVHVRVRHTCGAGCTGFGCEVDINECLSSPCVTGAVTGACRDERARCAM